MKISKLKNNIVILFFLSSISLSCTSNKQITVLPIHEEKQVIIRKTWKNYPSKYGNKFAYASTSCKLVLKYPQIRGKSNIVLQDKINKSIKNYFFELPSNSCPEDYIPFQIPKNPSLKQRVTKSDSQSSNLLTALYGVRTKSSKLLSLRVSYGPIYGNPKYPDRPLHTAYNIDLETGKPIYWNDMFEESKLKETYAMITKNLQSDPYYKNYDRLPRNFHFVLDGNYFICFFYYSTSTEIWEVRIPKKELTKLMKKEYKKLW